MQNRSLYISLSFFFLLWSSFVTAQSYNTWRISERNTTEHGVEFDGTELNFYTNYIHETMHYSAQYPDVIDSVYAQTRRDQGNWTHLFTTYLNPVVTISPNNKTVLYNICLNGSGYPLKRIEVYDNRDHLIQLTRKSFSTYYNYWHVNNQYIYYRPDNSIDSVYKSSFSEMNGQINSQIAYSKTIPTYDEQGRKQFEIIYTSQDSIQWNPAIKNILAYTNETYPTGFEYKVNNPLFDICPNYWGTIMNYNFPGLSISGVVDSVTVQEYNNGMWQDSNYDQYTITQNTTTGIGIYISDIDLSMVPYPPDYVPGWLSFSFDANGCFSSQYSSIDDGLAPPWDETIIYTWQHIVPNEDEFDIPPSLLNITTYPNPFSDNLTFMFKSKDNVPSDISIYNIKGQLIRQWKQTKAKELTWDGKDINNKPVANGIYFLRVNQAGHISTQKIIRIK